MEDVKQGRPACVTESTPLLPRYGLTAKLRAHAVAGPCLWVHAPPEPRDDQGRPPPPQLLGYSARRVGSVLSLLQLRGTVFASWSLWLHVLANFAVASAVCAVVFLGCQQPELISTDRISEVVAYSSELLALLLVAHLAVAVRRWWSMRAEALGGLWAASGDLALLLSAHLPAAAELKALVLRYSLASLELLFMQAQGTDGVLGGLVRQKLLTDDEKRKLEELVSKPQAVWVWIAGIFQRLAERGKLSSRLLVSVYGICTRARASVGRGRGAFAYLDSQLPYPYVHLLAVFVHLNNLAIAAKCGVVAAIAIRNLRRAEAQGAVSRAENLQVLVLQVLFAIGAPALFHAFLQEAAGLSDPFADRFQDFPRQACHIWMRSECEALHAAGARLPDEVLQVTTAFEVREGDLVQDRVALVG